LGDKRLGDIKRLQERVRELYDSAENKQRQTFWKLNTYEGDYSWHPLPDNKNGITYFLEFEKSGYSQIFGYSLEKFYNDPVEYAYRSLQAMVWKFEMFNDTMPIAKGFNYWPGVGMEKGMFGFVGTSYNENSAWVGRKGGLPERINFDAYLYPTYFELPIMKHIIFFYDSLKVLMDDDFEVGFPVWLRSPWGVAWHLRGLEEILVDYIEDFEWTEKFLWYIVGAQEKWTDEKNAYLGIKKGVSHIYNDEVAFPVVSPNMYENLILPTEVELSHYFGGIIYWHSCGDTTPMAYLIDRIPNMCMVHLSPWTNIWKAASAYNRDKILEIALHPVADITNPDSTASLRQKLIDAVECTKNHAGTLVRADGIAFTGDVQEGLEQVKRWNIHAREIFLGDK
jgi:hypothetical protein